MSVLLLHLILTRPGVHSLTQNPRHCEDVCISNFDSSKIIHARVNNKNTKMTSMNDVRNNYHSYLNYSLVPAPVLKRSKKAVAEAGTRLLELKLAIKQPKIASKTAVFKSRRNVYILTFTSTGFTGSHQISVMSVMICMNYIR